MGYFGGSPVNAFSDYDDINDFNPYDPEIKIPADYRRRAVRRYYPVSRSMSGLGALDLSTAISSAKNFVSDNLGMVLLFGIGFGVFLVSRGTLKGIFEKE